MKYSGLHFVPAHVSTADSSTQIFAALISSLESQYPSATRGPAWELKHRLLRSIPTTTLPATAQSQPPPISYQHVFHLSYLSPGKSYCLIQPLTPTSAQQVASASQQPPSSNPSLKPDPGSSTNGSSSVKPEPTSNAPTPQAPAQPLVTATPQTPSSLIAIPKEQTDSHTQFLSSTLAPLWQFRHALQVPATHGVSYTVGQFTVHVGEIKMNRPPGQGGGGQISPGVVMCISTEIGGATDENEDEVEGADGEGHGDVDMDVDEEEIDLDDAEQLIKGFWSSIQGGVERLGAKIVGGEIREVMQDKSMVMEHLRAKNKKEGRGRKSEDAVVRMWCEVLRLRG